jgi:uncharacterized protein (DUF983 family)
MNPPAADRRTRNVVLAVRRGLIGRCPNCGGGAMFGSYLTVNPHCPICAEDLSFERADDSPSWLTLLIVSVLVGAGVLISEDAWPDAPLLLAAVLWLAVTVIASLLILPRMKGAVVGYQWATRMHGFSGGRAQP